VKSRTLIFAANRFSGHFTITFEFLNGGPSGNASKLTELEPIKMRIEWFAVQGGTYHEQ